MQLKEVTVVNKTQAYSAEFFKEVSRKPIGKLFAFEQDLPETTIRSQAATFGKSLGVKFTVVAIPGEKDAPKKFAVGVTDKTRKPRTPKGPVPASTPVVTNEPVLDGPSASDQEDAVSAIVDQEGI